MSRSPRVVSAVVALALACALGLHPGATRAAAGPHAGPVEWLPPSSPLVRDIELLRASGLADTAVTATTFPLERRQVAAVVARARRLHPESRDPSLVRLEREFARELVDWGLAAPPGYTKPFGTFEDPHADSAATAEPRTRARLWSYADGALDARKGDTRFADRSRVGGRLNVERGGLLLHLDAYAGKVAGATRFADQLVTGSEFIAYSEDTYGSWSGGGVDLTLGRTSLGFGPGASGSLLWSSTADPITLVTFSTTLFRHVRATAVAGDVDASNGARIAAHRLEWFPSERLSIGLGEAARYTSSTLEPLYLVSILPYTWVQRMLAQDRLDRAVTDTAGVRNNVMAALDVSWRALPGAVAYGELLLDDQGFKIGGEPTRIGYQAGGLWTRALGLRGRGSLRGEYTRVYRYVYSVFYGADFIQHGKPIGYPLGPDSRAILVDARLAPSADWELGLKAEKQDLGEGVLGQFYDPSGPPASGSQFGGVVETTKRLTASVRAFPRDGVDVRVEAARAWVTNAAHVSGATSAAWTGRLGFRLRY